MADRPRIDSQLVCEFVGHAHSDLDRIKAMLAEQPALVNAAWDWGAGDWETGLGAAAHMGRRDIAQFLLARGARMDRDSGLGARIDRRCCRSDQSTTFCESVARGRCDFTAVTNARAAAVPTR